MLEALKGTSLRDPLVNPEILSAATHSAVAAESYTSAEESQPLVIRSSNG